MNFTLSDIIIIGAVALLFFAWWQNTAISEQALSRAQKHCEKLQLQLLDDTVSRESWRPIWQNGTIKIKRTYRFEFTSSGKTRYLGKISFIGRNNVEIWLSPHDF